MGSPTAFHQFYLSIAPFIIKVTPMLKFLKYVLNALFLLYLVTSLISERPRVKFSVKDALIYGITILFASFLLHGISNFLLFQNIPMAIK
jgi:hypothetical protein